MTSSVRHSLLLCCLVLAACQAAAPALPPDTTGSTAARRAAASDFAQADLDLSCEQIAGQQADATTQIDAGNKAIGANRRSNEIATYAGAFFTPIYIATESNSDDKAAIQKAYQRRDTLEKLRVFKGCP